MNKQAQSIGGLLIAGVVVAVLSGGFESGFNGLGGTAFARFGAFVIEDPEQMVVALRRSEGEPRIAGAGVAQKECAKDGRRIVLAFESVQQHLGDLFSAAGSAGRSFWLVSKLAKLAASGVAQGVEQPAELAIGVECAHELGGKDDGALDEVGLKPDADARADAGVGTGLHLLVDEEKMAAAARIGEERSAEGEAGDLAAHATAIAYRPGFGNVEGNACDDPFERGSVWLQKRGEGFARIG